MNAELELVVALARQIHPSPTNPRKSFPEESIAEMSASISQKGVIQPLIVRRWPAKDRANEKSYEIVCGERRFRGGSAAGLEKFPVIVRELSDNDVREIQLIENLQREDVSPYEEAVGYADLLELKDAEGASLYDVARISNKIGKTPQYVRNRLKVQRAPKVLLDAMREGKVGVRVCEIVGRIPHAKDREACAREALEDQWDGQPLTAEEVQELVHHSYMMPLKKAPFDRKTETLVPKVGSCEACPFRSGNDEALKEDLAEVFDNGRGRSQGVDPQLCLNPSCYRAKCDAHVDLLRKADASQVLSDDEAAKVFDEWGYVKHTSQLVLAEHTPGYRDLGHYDGSALGDWGTLARELEVPVRVAKSPKTGALVELVDSKAVKEADWIKAAAQKKEPRFPKKGTNAEEQAKTEREQKAEKRRREVANEEVLVALDQLSDRLVGKFDREAKRQLLRMSLNHAGVDIVTRWMGVKVSSKPGHATDASDRQDAILAMVEDEELYDEESLLILCLCGLLSEGLQYYGLGSMLFADLAAVYSLDKREITKAAKERVKEREAEAAQAKKAKETAGLPKALAGSAEGAPDEWFSNPNRGINEHRLVKLVGALQKAEPGTKIDAEYVRHHAAATDTSHGERLLVEAKRRGLVPADGVIEGAKPAPKKKVAAKKAVAKKAAKKKVPAKKAASKKGGES